MIEAIEAGCAECWSPTADGPLITVRNFNNFAEAKEHYHKQQWLRSHQEEIDWRLHPQGGEHVVAGQGSVWLRSTTCQHNVIVQDDPQQAHCVSCGTPITAEINAAKNYQFDEFHELWVNKPPRKV